ncbi:MAG: aminotransferase class IV family protein [Phycisphaerales bacterium]|nr:aminotransferase class IV family protein [Phycisphaerales bacterium]
MPEAIFLNGQFIDGREAARLSAFDAGVQHAVGLFETMAGGNEMTSDGPRPWVLRLGWHIERISESARALGLSASVRSGALGEAVLLTVQQSGLERARVRLTLTGGDLSLLAPARGPIDPTVLIVAQPATEYPGEMFERGVTVRIADTRANPLNPFESHKTLNYWWRLSELRRAAAAGCGEALVLAVTNHVCGGCVSNLFVRRGDELLTPPARGDDTAGALPSPVLPGVTRRLLLDATRHEGMAVRTRLLGVNDVLDADEVFLTNSSWGVLPVTKVEGKAIGGGAVGETTRRLRRLWTEAIDDERS